MSATGSPQATIIPEWDLPQRDPRRELRVGVIADEFTELCLRWEWHQSLITPNWREELQNSPIDLLFVESAWKGNGGAWQYALTGSKAPTDPLRELVAHCRATGLPTVFWNKEDPVHFEDFLPTAALFDWVLTSDAAMVAGYVERLGHDRVAPMSFAAASWIHNPVRMFGPPSRDVAFAGTYYRHRFPERRKQMDLLLGAAADVSSRMPHGLEIFSRFQDEDERYHFPSSLSKHVRPALSYPQMLSAYRDFKVFLNVNSVPDSSTMCPRRIFEISACSTPVVSTPTPAIENYFGPGEVITVSEPEETRWTLRAVERNTEWRDRVGHRAARRVLTEHTYRHRIDELLERVGLEEHRVIDPSISVIASTNRPGQLDHLLASVAGQMELSPQLVLVTHGFQAPSSIVGLARAQGIDDLILVEASESLSLGECLNLAVARAEGEVVAKMDDDDFYGPHYLADQRRALDYSGADVVGKHAHHLLLQDIDALMVRFPHQEHRFTHLVMGPTLMMRRELVEQVPFAARTRGEDTDFLRRVLHGNGLIYAADRFGFVQVRRADGHTWSAPDVELLANGHILAYGAGVEHAFP